MATYEWVFGSATSNLHVSVAIDSETKRIVIESFKGSLDLNALWFSDGDRIANEDGGSTALRGMLNSLKMSGSGIVWDDVAILSGAEASVAAGETLVLDGTVLLAGYTPEDWGSLILGVRASAMCGHAPIRLVDRTATELLAGDDTAAGQAGAGAITGNVLANDTGRAGTTLKVVSFAIEGVAGAAEAGETVTIAGVGTLTIGQDGAFAFTPAAGFSGEVPPVTYTATDADGADPALGVTLGATLRITVEGGTGSPPTDILLGAGGVLAVEENVAGAVFGTLSVVDPDAGDTHALVVDDARFEVTPGGVLKLKDGIALDFEAGAMVTVGVTATDSTGGSVTRDFTIAVANRDELAPVFTSGTVASIAEDAGAGQVVYAAAAVDDAADLASGSLAYSLEPGGDAGLFSIDPATGAVTLLAAPDFESQASYSFTVVATDAAGNAAQQTVTLAVINRDELPPIFTSPTTAAIEENSGPGQVIYDADAGDDPADAGSGAISYSLAEEGDAALLAIDATTGEVTLAEDPDFETRSSYDFTVVATDGAGNSAQRAVTVAVGNRDDRAPIFASGTTANAAENSGPGRVVYTAVAVDDPSDVTSSPITYGLKASGNVAAFSIDAATGAVTLADDPDYEAMSSYAFTVTAADGAGNVAERDVTLFVTNRDELPPIFTSGSLASVNENSGAGQVVYDADAADDLGDFSTGAVTYALAETGDAAALSIDAATGEVTLAADPDFETKASYAFTVTATDDAGNVAQQAVTLTIVNVDETPVEKTMTFNAGVNNTDSYEEGGLRLRTEEPALDSLRFGNFFFADPDLETQAQNPLATPLRFERVDGGTFGLVSVINHSGTGSWVGFNGETQVVSQSVSAIGTVTFQAGFTNLTHVVWTVAASGSASQSIDNLIWV